MTAQPTLFPPAQLRTTWEQDAIAEAFAGGQSFLVRAGAGTAKSTTIEQMIVKAPRRERKILLLSYNRGVVMRAEKRAEQLGLADVLVCKTAHQLGFGSVGYRYKDAGIRIATDGIEMAVAYSESDLIEQYGAPDAFEFATGVIDTLSRYTAMHERVLGIEHVPPALRDGDPEIYLDAAKNLWEAICAMDTRFPIWHDVYVKRYALSDPKLSKKYAAIIFDEAQDASPVMLDITERQSDLQRAYFGDNAQAIYGFRHAVDALKLLRLPSFGLTQSFRFGPNIAAYVNAILAAKGDTLRITGVAEDPGFVNPSAGSEPATLILARTNVGVFVTAFTMVAAGKKVTMGREFRYQSDMLSAAYDLYASKRVKDTVFSRFANWEDCKVAATSEQGGYLAPFVKLVEQYAGNIPTLLAQVASSSSAPSRGGVQIATIHARKGDEDDVIAFADDFRRPIVNGKMDTEESNLWYVAATRARRGIVLGPMAEMSRELFGEPEFVTGVTEPRIVYDRPASTPAGPRPPQAPAPAPPPLAVAAASALAPRIASPATSLLAALATLDGPQSSAEPAPGAGASGSVTQNVVQVVGTGTSAAANDGLFDSFAGPSALEVSEETEDGAGEIADEPGASDDVALTIAAGEEEGLVARGLSGRRSRGRSFALLPAEYRDAERRTLPTPIMVKRGQRLYALRRGARVTTAGWVVPAGTSLRPFRSMMVKSSIPLVVGPARLEPVGEPTVFIGRGLRDVLGESAYELLRRRLSAKQDGRCLMCLRAGEVHPHARFLYGEVAKVRDYIGVCAECHPVLHLERATDDRGIEARLAAVNRESALLSRERIRLARGALAKANRRWWSLETMEVPREVAVAAAKAERARARIERIDMFMRGVVAQVGFFWQCF